LHKKNKSRILILKAIDRGSKSTLNRLYDSKFCRQIVLLVLHFTSAFCLISANDYIKTGSVFAGVITWYALRKHYYTAAEAPETTVHAYPLWGVPLTMVFYNTVVRVHF